LKAVVFVGFDTVTLAESPIPHNKNPWASADFLGRGLRLAFDASKVLYKQHKPLTGLKVFHERIEDPRRVSAEAPARPDKQKPRRWAGALRSCDGA
jgi:hypothetical protein